MSRIFIYKHSRISLIKFNYITEIKFALKNPLFPEIFKLLLKIFTISYLRYGKRQFTVKVNIYTIL